MQDDAAVLGQKGLHHVAVLLANSPGHHRHAAGRDPEIEADVIRVPQSRPEADTEHDLMLAAAANDLVQERDDGVLAAVHNAAAADRHDVHVRQHGDYGLLIGGGHHGLVHEAFAHQIAAHMRPAACGVL